MKQWCQKNREMDMFLAGPYVASMLILADAITFFGERYIREHGLTLAQEKHPCIIQSPKEMQANCEIYHGEDGEKYIVVYDNELTDEMLAIASLKESKPAHVIWSRKSLAKKQGGPDS